MAVLYPTTQFFDNNGDPIAAGLIYTYIAGTTTPQATYTNADGNVAETNPIVMSASGRAHIWLQAAQNYDLVIKNAAGTITYDTIEDVSSDGITVSLNATLNANLDTNNFNISFDDNRGIVDDSSNEQLIFQKTASAVNYVEITNAATGTGPIIGTAGETNVDLNITPTGTGLVKVTNGLDLVDRAELRFFESTGNGTNHLDMRAAASMAGNLTVTLPTASGTLMVGANNLSEVTNAATAATNLGLGTASNPQFATIELGNASDTTLARSAAGSVTIEGNVIYRAGGTDVPLTDGGTGASDAATARTNLGVPGFTVLSEQLQASSTASNVASITFSDSDNTQNGMTINTYRIHIHNIAPITDDVELKLTVLDTSGVEITTSYKWHLMYSDSSTGVSYESNGSDTSISLTGTQGVGNAALEHLSGEILVMSKPAGAYATIIGHLHWINAAGNLMIGEIRGQRVAPGIDGVKLAFSSGNINTIEYSVFVSQ